MPRQVNSNEYPQHVFICVSGFSSEKTRYGRSALYFILLKDYIEILPFSLHFPPFFTIFDYTVLKIHNKMFRVGAKTQVRSVNLKHMYTYFFFALSVSANTILTALVDLCCSFDGRDSPGVSGLSVAVIYKVY